MLFFKKKTSSHYTR